MDRDLTVGSYYAENFDHLCKKISGKVGSIYDAEDVVQEAFSRVLKYWDSYNQAKEFEGWFMGILSNSIKDFLRDDRLGGMTTEDEECKEELVDLNHLDLPADEIKEAIEAKKESTRDILFLYFLREHTPRDISEILGVPNKTIRMCVWRFKKDMEDKLGDGSLG